jgi:hypothetical protein
MGAVSRCCLNENAPAGKAEPYMLETRFHHIHLLRWILSPYYLLHLVALLSGSCCYRAPRACGSLLSKPGTLISQSVISRERLQGLVALWTLSVMRQIKLRSRIIALLSKIMRWYGTPWTARCTIVTVLQPQCESSSKRFDLARGCPFCRKHGSNNDLILRKKRLWHSGLRSRLIARVYIFPY